MEIKDLLGKYILNVDIIRRVIYETNIGYWKLEDMERFQNDYTTNVIPLLKGKIWAKCCDLRNFKPSMITQEIKEHVKWCIENGYTTAAMIVDDLDTYKSVIELQMEIAIRHSQLVLKSFISLEEADQWLKEQGF